MRLDTRTRNIIREEVEHLIGTANVIRLFGSRVDDDQRGGDIDLLVACPNPVTDRVRAECRLSARLYLILGDRKVDVLIRDPDTAPQAVHEQALRYGVML